MIKRRVVAEYAIETRGPLHIGTGRGAAGLQRAMLRDKDGLPYLPGSTIKGRARYAAVRICDWMGLSVLKDAVVDVPGDRRRSPNGPDGERDLPSRIFGNAWSRCTLCFEDARPEPPVIEPGLDAHSLRALHDRSHGLREIRSGAARSRLLGTVSHQRLYRSEVAPPGLTLSGHVRGYLDCVDPDYEVEVLVLWLSLHLMVEDGAGGGKSAGNGKLSWATGRRIVISVDGQAFSPSEDDAASVLGLLGDIEAAGGRP